VSNATAQLPVPVKDGPHWRVVIRPHQYAGHLLKDGSACLKFIEQNRVRMRGWDFPALAPEPSERQFDDSGMSAWCNFMGNIEYWKLFNSGQFVHLERVRETTDLHWQRELANRSQRWKAMRQDRKPTGFVDLLNSLYRFIEIFEFAKRLAQSTQYQSPVDITIQMHAISGFELTAPMTRVLPPTYVCSATDISIDTSSTLVDLIANQRLYALRAFNRFLERFSLIGLTDDNFGRDYDNFVSGRY
jgi:hypothetical protein